jgi:hypothetical protein
MAKALPFSTKLPARLLVLLVLDPSIITAIDRDFRAEIA